VGNTNQFNQFCVICRQAPPISTEPARTRGMALGNLLKLKA
jgi:hypothetical protein